MRNLVVATNWENRLLNRLSETGLYKNVKELFGSLATSAIGSGRSDFMLPDVSLPQVKEHIKQAHSMGLEFNYCINAPCLGNQEYDRETRIHINELLTWITGLAVDRVTVANPYLAEIIKTRFPSLKMSVSVIAEVDSVQKAKVWGSLGVDRITISYMANRDFELIDNVKNTVMCDLAVLTNDNCLYQCPFRMYHYNIAGHDSKPPHLDSEFPSSWVRYPMVRCVLARLSDLSEIIKSRWIRPEDLQKYEGIGIKYFKISGRSRSTDWIMRCVKAYSERKYEGNLLDIAALPRAREALLFLPINEFREITEHFPIFVDNQRLNGVIDFMAKKNCRIDCTNCDFCSSIAKEAVRVVSEEKLQRYKRALEAALSSLTSGKFLYDERSAYRNGLDNL